MWSAIVMRSSYPRHVFVIDHLGKHRDARRRKYSREFLDCVQAFWHVSLPYSMVFGGLSPEFQGVESRNKILEVELQVALMCVTVSRSGGESFIFHKLTLILK